MEPIFVLLRALIAGIVWIGTFVWQVPMLISSKSTQQKKSPSTPSQKLSLHSPVMSPFPHMDFAVRGFHALAKSTEFVYSPLSLGVSLSLLMEAANGETRSQIMQFIATGGSIDEIRSIYSSLIATISNASETVLVQVASSVFVDEKRRLSTTFAGLVKGLYASVTQLIDFSEGEAAAQIVNDFIAKATDHLIQGSFSEEHFRSNTGAILISAIYFKADWANQFIEFRSHKDPFFGLAGIREDKFMHDLRFAHGGETDDLTFLSLLYRDPAYSLLLLKPEGDFLDWRSKLTSSYLESVISSAAKMEMVKCQISMPKFTVECKMRVKEMLMEEGVTDCFDRECANLAGLSTDNGLYVGSMVQRAIFQVDEEGTTAAEVDEEYVEARGGEMNESPLDLNFNRPFVFILLRGPDPIFIGQYV